jgi:hypothetical protein
MSRSDLPTAKILVRALVLTMGSVAGATSQAQPIPTEVPSADLPAWAFQEPTVQGTSLIVTGAGIAKTPDEAVAAAQLAASEALIAYLRKELAAQVPLPPPEDGDFVGEARAALNADPSWLGPQLERVTHVGLEHAVALRHTVPDWAGRLTFYTNAQEVDGIHFLAGLPQAPVRIVHSPVKQLHEGDVVLAVQGIPLQSIRDFSNQVFNARSRNEAPVLLIKRGKRTLNITLDQPVIYKEIRELAPTCGPCCHGHCDDEFGKPW